MVRTMRALITERVARAAKPSPDGKPYDIRDTAIPGFTLRVLGSGSKSWTLVYSLAGRRRRMDLGRYPWLEAPAAREQAKAAVDKVQAGIDPQGAPRPAAPVLTVAKMGALYIEGHAKRHKRSWREDQRMLALYVYPAWGELAAVAVSRKDGRDLVTKVAETKPVQANRLLALVSKLFAWGAVNDHIPANPMFRLPKPTSEAPRTRVLTDAEVARVWRSTLADKSPLARIYTLMLLTGQRGGEVRQMAYDDLDGRWWNLPPEITKNGLPQRVYLTNRAAEIVAAARRRKAQTHVFPSAHWRRGEAAAVSPRRVFERVRDRAALGKPWTPHDLRRTVGTKLAQLGVNKAIRMRVLNHADHSVTSVYDLYQYDREVREALTLLADAWAAVLVAHPE